MLPFENIRNHGFIKINIFLIKSYYIALVYIAFILAGGASAPRVANRPPANNVAVRTWIYKYLQILINNWV